MGWLLPFKLGEDKVMLGSDGVTEYKELRVAVLQMKERGMGINGDVFQLKWHRCARCAAEANTDTVCMWKGGWCFGTIRPHYRFGTLQFWGPTPLPSLHLAWNTSAGNGQSCCLTVSSNVELSLISN